MTISGVMKPLGYAHAAALLLSAGGAWAQSAEDKYWLRGAIYSADVDSSIAVNAINGSIGTDVDFETDLKLDERRVLPSFSGGVRLGSRWQITADIYTLKREGTRAINRELVVDDVVYPVGATISSGFRSTTYRIAAGYSFLRGQGYEAGASLGVHLTDFSVFLEGQGSVGGAGASVERRNRQLLAPLPTIGLYGSYEAVKDVTIGARVDYLKLKISDFTGALINAEAGVTWRFHENIGIGAMYRHVDYDLDVEKDNWDGGIGYRFSGPMLFVEIGF